MSVAKHKLTRPTGAQNDLLRSDPYADARRISGMVNNLYDGPVWGLFPALFAAGGLSIERIGILAAVYPAVWGAGQLNTGPSRTGSAANH